ncbi:MAG TPA: hypothetical protein VN848_13260 [Gemmatimonadales bacterium]|nr:hypothetical protein [Gemmatimonadales bacterium]
MRAAVFALVFTTALAAQNATVPENPTLRRALAAADSLDFGQAVILARQALAQRMSGPDQARAYGLLGFSYGATDSQAKAVEAFKQAILLDPDHELDQSKVSPKITSLFYAAMGQVLVIRKLQVDSAHFVAGRGAVAVRFTITTPARVRVHAVNGATSLLVDSAVVTGSVVRPWSAQLPNGDPVPAGTWLIVVDASSGQDAFSASRSVRVSYGAVDTMPHLTSLPGYQELPETALPPRSWRPMGIAFLSTTAAVAGAFALNNGSLGSPPSRELIGVGAATLVAGLVMTLRHPTPQPAPANILYNRLLREQLERRNSDIATENAKARHEVALTIVALPEGTR